MENKRERAITVGIGLKSESIKEIKISLAELEDLADTAGAEIVANFTQQVESYTPATLIGSGKVQEIAETCKECEAGLVFIDHNLSGVQLRNLEEEFKVKVLDRSQLILDIFAQRAQTYEGKLQVELAQLMDQLPRMVGGWLGSLSRLGGGIGTRGPGETAIEMDRRVIRNKMKAIREKLKVVQKNRKQHRARRSKNNIPSFALIGYTNAGKSTLLNSLTQSEIYVEDQLFATLDPTTRNLYLKGVGNTVITDTVGFIRKLPTHLIEAFKATLEESAESDLLLHVIDLSSPQLEKQIEVVDQLIKDFNWQNKPIIHVFNKVDQASPDKKFKVHQSPRVFISAKEKEGIEALKLLMIESVQSLTNSYELFFSNTEQYLIYDLARESQIIDKQPSSVGVVVKVLLTKQQVGQWSQYLITK